MYFRSITSGRAAMYLLDVVTRTMRKSTSKCQACPVPILHLVYIIAWDENKSVDLIRMNSTKLTIEKRDDAHPILRAMKSEERPTENTGEVLKAGGHWRLQTNHLDDDQWDGGSEDGGGGGCTLMRGHGGIQGRNAGEGEHGRCYGHVKAIGELVIIVLIIMI